MKIKIAELKQIIREEVVRSEQIKELEAKKSTLVNELKSLDESEKKEAK